MSRTRVVEGVFAINKPPEITSAQVIRDLQKAFNPSELFAPWLAVEKANRARQARFQKDRRRDKRLQVKIGHGGTLDPLATGILIIGVGKGTKHLQNFLSCTKTYEATLLFGIATDTYDTKGRVLSKAPYSHISKEKVEEALKGFRGRIMQRPPIYSALSMHGKRLYEYAREGKELPAEIKERPVTVEELKISEWLVPGSHTYNWPAEDALEEAKEVAEKVLGLGDANAQTASLAEMTEHEALQSRAAKRKPPPIYDEHDLLHETGRAAKRKVKDSEVLMSGGLPPQFTANDEVLIVSLANEPRKQIKTDKPSQSTGQPQPPPQITVGRKGEYDSDVKPPVSFTPLLDPRISSQNDKGPPAVRLHMTVTSGFYVRSLCHDLGKVLASLGVMAALVRTRQGDFELGKNALDYNDLEKGEDTWGPIVANMLDVWQASGASETEVSSTRDEKTADGREKVGSA
ncbi:hypothetical protein MMC13_007483 [Lambiella insularis]|nr:hypothetical protein [Lambiella insularis]